MMTGNGVMHNGTTIIDDYGQNLDRLKVCYEFFPFFLLPRLCFSWSFNHSFRLDVIL